MLIDTPSAAGFELSQENELAVELTEVQNGFPARETTGPSLTPTGRGVSSREPKQYLVRRFPGWLPRCASFLSATHFMMRLPGSCNPSDSPQ